MFVKPIRQLSNQAHSIALKVSPEVKWHPLTARRAIFAAWVVGPSKRRRSNRKKSQRNPKIDFRVRKDALIALLEWNNPPVPDPVTGFARTLPKNRIKLDTSIIKDLKGLIDGVDKNSIDLIPRALILSEQDQIPLGELRLTRYLKEVKNFQKKPALNQMKASCVSQRIKSHLAVNTSKTFRRQERKSPKHGERASLQERPQSRNRPNLETFSRARTLP